MRRAPWLIFGPVLLVALFVALGCAEIDAPPDARDLPQPRTEEETLTAAPTITPTATSTSTPTPTITPTPSNTPTPTNTPTNTPTMQASNYGVHVYSASVLAGYADCEAAVAAGASETWEDSKSALYTNPLARINLKICNLAGAARTCAVSSNSTVTGWSTALYGKFGCVGNSGWCNPPNNFIEGMTLVRSLGCSAFGKDYYNALTFAYTRTQTINPYDANLLSDGVMEVYVDGGGALSYFGCVAGGNLHAKVDCGPTPTASPTASPSPTVTPTPSITPTPSSTPTPSITPSVTPTSAPGITPTAVGCAYQYCASNATGTPVANALVAVAQDRQATNVIRSAKTDTDSCRNFYLPGGLTYFFPQKANNTFTNPDARNVPTPSSSSCGWEYCVVDASATPQPITDAIIAVSTTKTGTNYIQTGRTDATGCVRFVDIPPGNYYIFRSSPTFVFATNPDEEAIP